MTMLQDERAALIARFADGPARLRAALASVPAEALKFRPSAGAWSTHEIIVHCADSEANAALRIRYLVFEKVPVIVGYDQEEWARSGDYHSQPIDLALAVVVAVRASTVAFILGLPDEAWLKAGRHTEHAEPYTAERWLGIYATHLEEHAAQIEANVVAWERRVAPSGNR